MKATLMLASVLLGSFAPAPSGRQSVDLTVLQKEMDTVTAFSSREEAFNDRPLMTMMVLDDRHAVRLRIYHRYCDPNDVNERCQIYEELRVHPISQ